MAVVTGDTVEFEGGAATVRITYDTTTLRMQQVIAVNNGPKSLIFTLLNTRSGASRELTLPAGQSQTVNLPGGNNFRYETVVDSDTGLTSLRLGPITVSVRYE